MDRKAPYIRMAGLLVIAYIYLYASDESFKDEYNLTLDQAKAQQAEFRANLASIEME